METLKWRRRARVVAYVDLVEWIDVLLVLLWLCGVLGYATANVAAVTDQKVYWFGMFEIGIKWVFVALLAGISGYHLWASLMLLSATQFGRREVSEALEEARKWQGVTCCLLGCTALMMSWATIILVSAAHSCLTGLSYLHPCPSPCLPCIYRDNSSD